MHFSMATYGGLFNSNLDLASADGISETLAIGDLAGGPMDRWPMGRWESGCWDPGSGPTLSQLWAESGPTAGRLLADFRSAFG